MKKFYLLLTTYYLLLVGIVPVNAFWTNTENLERTQQTIRVDHRSDQSEVTLDEVITNTSNETQDYIYLVPLTQVSSLNLYLDGNGLSHQKLKGPTLLETLWNYDQRDLLQLGQYHNQNVLISEPVTIAAGKSRALKFKYRTKPSTTNNVQHLHIDVADRLNSAEFETSFNLVSTNQHFLTPAHLDGLRLIEGGTTSWLHTSESYQSDEALDFIWSNANPAKLHYRYDGFDYALQLNTPPAPETWETVTILIDQSGSMFGDRWQHSQVVVKEFLKNLSPSTKFRVGFFDDEVSWFHEVAVTNNATEQKKFFDWWESQVPTGRTDWSQLQDVLRDLQLQQSALSKSAGFIMGDFSEFSVDESDYLNLKSFRRSLLLDFANNETVSFWSRLNDGQYQTILSEDADLIQWPNIFSAWKRLNLAQNPPSDLQNKKTFPTEINYFPADRSLLWLSRDLMSDNHMLSQADFIPRLWAERRVANDLRRAAITSLSEGQKLALSSIVRVLGVHQGIIDPQLDKETLFGAIEDLAFQDLWRLIWKLESPTSQPQDLVLQNGKPIFLEGDDTWISADFERDFGLKSGLHIENGSEAERQLFYFFPDLLSRALSLGENVGFCADRRCLRLSDDGESQAKETHKLDWRARLKPHWANSFAITLANENIVSIDPFGDLKLDQPVTRGEFIRWLTESYFGTDFTERTADIGDPRFTDVTDESTKMAEAIYLLRRKGVIQGYEDGTVRPEKPLARAEAVKILLALDGYKLPRTINTDDLPFQDIKGWEIPWVRQAQKTGLVQGYPDGTFKPFQPLTRGEGMKLVVSF